MPDFLSMIQRLSQLKTAIQYDRMMENREELGRQLEDPCVWQNPSRMRVLQKEKEQLDSVMTPLQDLEDQLIALKEVYAEALQADLSDWLVELDTETQALEMKLQQLWLQRLWRSPEDKVSAFLDVQAGSGGTEAQDWADMLLRMYVKWGASHRFQVQLTERSEGEVAGIKSATLHIQGMYAYGWLKYETGIHRLVRPSPFDANHKRHTSFASIFVYPEIDESIEVEIKASDLRVDTYRASGAGGQHVNRTESAIRITHIPTQIVVQCQIDRSQHKNREWAMRQLRAKLYDLELTKRKQKKQEQEQKKSDIGWGHQIRSYVLDDARVKDLRSHVEKFNPQKVLDGDLDDFMRSVLELYGASDDSIST